MIHESPMQKKTRDPVESRIQALQCLFQDGVDS